MLFCIWDPLVSRKTKKQSIISHSLSEAEYRALETTISELQWPTFLLHDLRVDIVQPANLLCDN